MLHESVGVILEDIELTTKLDVSNVKGIGTKSN